MKLYEGDCLEIMKTLEAGIVDMVLCDLPYGTTDCAWDTVIPFDLLWMEYWRVCKPSAAIVLTASQPFTSSLGSSQIKYLKRSLVWNKKKAGNIAQSGFMELKIHEDILVFHREKPTYNAQKTQLNKPQTRHLGKASINKQSRKDAGGMGGEIKYSKNYEPDKKLPTTIIEFSHDRKHDHPTQKPVALMEYLIRTYSNENDTILDNCMGSGTTGVACKNTNRNFIGIERDPGYFSIAKKRIEDHIPVLC